MIKHIENMSIQYKKSKQKLDLIEEKRKKNTLERHKDLFVDLPAAILKRFRECWMPGNIFS